MKRFNDELKEKRKQINEASERVRTEKEYLDIECRWEYNWNRNIKTLVRLDTFQDVEERVIDKEERQLYLDGIKAAEKAATTDEQAPE